MLRTPIRRGDAYRPSAVPRVAPQISRMNCKLRLSPEQI
jgi:hypothetical protein